MKLHLLPTVVRVLRIGILLSRSAGGAIALGSCRGEGMEAPVTLRSDARRAAGTRLGLYALAVSEREGGPGFRILHDCTV